MTIAVILKEKGSEVATLGPDTTIAEIATRLADRRIGAVLIRDEAGVLTGIVSERDIVRVIARDGASALDLPARRVMTADLTTATPGTSVAEAMGLMTAGRFRHLPVLDGARLVGIVSIGDIVKARLSQQEHEVDSLKAYVAGS